MLNDKVLEYIHYDNNFNENIAEYKDMGIVSLIGRERRKYILNNIKTLQDFINTHIYLIQRHSNTRYNFNYSHVFNILKLINDNDTNAVIFENAGGMLFDIWFENETFKIEQFIKNKHITIYAYRINGETTILQHCNS